LLVKFRLTEPQQYCAEQIDEDIVEQFWFVNLSNTVKGNKMSGKISFQSFHFNGLFGKGSPMEIHFQPSIFGKDFFISSRDEVTKWELLSLYNEKFIKNHPTTEEQQDPAAALKPSTLSRKDVLDLLKASLLSKKIVEWRSHEDQPKKLYVETTMSVFRIERTGIKLVTPSEFETKSKPLQHYKSLSRKNLKPDFAIRQLSPTDTPIHLF
jgi:hypothetical protein